MKNKVLLVLREILIYFIIIALVIGAAFLLLRQYYPDKVTIPSAAKYSSLEKDKYRVVGDIQNAKNATITHETSTNTIETSQTELRYIPGSVNPFVAQGTGNDLPSEIVNRSTVTVNQQPATTEPVNQGNELQEPTTPGTEPQESGAESN